MSFFGLCASSLIDSLVSFSSPLCAFLRTHPGGLEAAPPRQHALHVLRGHETSNESAGRGVARWAFHCFAVSFWPQDLRGELKKLAAFMGKTVTDQQLERLAAHLGFESFSKNDAVNYEAGRSAGIMNPGGRFCRKGNRLRRCSFLQKTRHVSFLSSKIRKNGRLEEPLQSGAQRSSRPLDRSQFGRKRFAVRHAAGRARLTWFTFVFILFY